MSDQDGSATVGFGAVEAGAPRAPRFSVLVGPDGTVAKAYAKVTPADHPDEVLADLNSLRG